MHYRDLRRKRERGRELIKDLLYSTRNSTKYFLIPIWEKNLKKNGYMYKKKMKVKSLSCVQLFATLWTVAWQAPSSMGFPGQEYWSGLPFPTREDLPNPGIRPRSPTLQADSLPSEPLGIYVQLNPFAIHWKLIQHCKSTII